MLRLTHTIGARRARARGATLAAVLLLTPVGLACHQEAAAQNPDATTQPLLAVRQVEPQWRDAWAKVDDAREEDPTGEAVDRAADELLAAQPPLDLEVAARVARAERRWLLGDDLGALAELAMVEGKLAEVAPRLAETAQRLGLRAWVRGGEPAEALRRLDEQGALFSESERLAARAVALDRAQRAEEAILAHLRWRASLDDADPAATWALDRVKALLDGFPADRVVALAERAERGPGRDCLTLWAELEAGAKVGAKGWARECRARPPVVGVLLPRSGKLSVLADEHIAAASAAVELLGASEHGQAVRVLWQDAGSGAKSAAQGVDSLVEAGATRIVGPVGRPAVSAVRKRTGSARLILPGESNGPGVGVAPSLEARVRAALRHALDARSGPVLVLTPTGSYGERAAKAARALASELGSNRLKFQEYPASTTSFASVLAPHAEALRGKGCVAVFDAVGRVELAVRQLRRVAESPDEFVVVSTAEGVGPKALGTGHEALDGVRVAPVAFARPEDAAFVSAFERREGRLPGDQALLVWRALSMAFSGESAPIDAQLAVVEGGRLVPIATP